ncbi:MAG: DUF5683 domain-containing protein [Chitinophagaceae bacterium]
MTNPHYYAFFCLFGLLLVIHSGSSAQTVRDSTGKRLEGVSPVNQQAPDSAAQQVSPRIAATRSAIIPGWGQVYVRQDLKRSFFKKYWKLPIIYGALGTSAGVFVYNLQWYRRTRFAYRTFALKDTMNFTKVYPSLQVFSADLSYLQQVRNDFRRDVDYSVLFFILLWGLNVVDATVDAHLKSFDVSPDLSLRFKPGYSAGAGTHGISLVLQFK